MIVSCVSCLAQNFVAEERRRVPGKPPLCWKCGGMLPPPPETVSRKGESKKGVGIENARRGETDA